MGYHTKNLQGGGGGFFNSLGLSGSYNTLTNYLETEGTISYGNTLGYDSGVFDFGNLAAGFGADICAVSEY